MTSQLTANRSTTELLRNNKLKEAYSCSLEPAYDRTKMGSSIFFFHIHREKRLRQQAPPRLKSPQGKGAAVNHLLSRFILINRSSSAASSLSRLTLPRGNKGWNYSYQKQGTYFSSQELAGMKKSPLYLSLQVSTTKQHFCYSIIEINSNQAKKALSYQ